MNAEIDHGLRACRRAEALVFEGRWFPFRFTKTPPSRDAEIDETSFRLIVVRPTSFMRTLICLLVLLLTTIVASAADSAMKRAVSVPRPDKLPEASARHLAGSGEFVLHVDKASGSVKSVTVAKSTGQPLLDQSAIQTLKRCRFARGAVEQARASLSYTASSDVGEYR
jgi:TonB family protein